MAPHPQFVLPFRRRAAIFAAAIFPLLLVSPLAMAAPDQADPAATSGRVVTWGGGLVGAEQELMPPAGLDDAVAVTASDLPGSAYDLALRADGTVLGWGRDPDGAAAPPDGLDDVIGIDTGAGFSVALRKDGSVVAWGSNSTGQLDVPGDLGRVTAVSAGGFAGTAGQACGFALALQADGTVVRWGSEPADGSCAGQLGAALDPPAGLDDVVAIAAGNRHALALRADGSVVGWGQNGAGQAQPPAGLHDVVAIAAGSDHSLALTADGTVLGWGVWGESGPPAVDDATAIAASRGDVILRRDGSIFLWTGYTWGDQPTGDDYVAIAAGYEHGAAIVRTRSAPPVALGSDQVQPFVDENPAGTAEAFRSVAAAGGTSTAMKVYVDASNAADRLEVGVYADDDGHPGRLLSTGSIDHPTNGDWNTAELAPTELTAGTAYWLALLGPHDTGRLRFRDLVEGEGGATEISAQTCLDRLPDPWRSGTAFGNAPASAHLLLG